MAEFFKAFPMLWALVGLVFAGGVFWVSSQRVFVMQGQANENLVKTLERHNSALETERDDYKNKLHTERDNHQSTQLKVKELELRPDMTTLFHNSEAFYSKQTEAMGSLIESIHKHDTSVGAKMQPVYDSLKTMGNGIEELLRRSEKRKRV